MEGMRRPAIGRTRRDAETLSPFYLSKAGGSEQNCISSPCRTRRRVTGIRTLMARNLRSPSRRELGTLRGAWDVVCCPLLIVIERTSRQPGRGRAEEFVACTR
eukprot:scaffold62524_cov23-Tisochrysis_lutea.AAC.1